MVKSRKIKRIIIRLSVYCMVFFILAAGYGLKYIHERETDKLYRRINDERAFASLCGYMSSIKNVLYRVNEERDKLDKMIGLSAEFSSLVGGSKAILASLPFNKAGRERLQTFFSESDFYIRSLALENAGIETAAFQNHPDIISEYIAYINKITGKLIAKENNTDQSVSLELKLFELQIDTPPSLHSISFDGEYVNASFTISEKQAKKKARSYLGDYVNFRRIESDKRFFRYASGSSFVDILRTGGFLLRLSSFRASDAEMIKITEADAERYAEEFLTNTGISDVLLLSESVYSCRYEAQYAPLDTEQTGIDRIVYIGVSLDTGKITYFDASDYYNIK